MTRGARAGLVALALAALALSGCEYYDKPYRPLPKHFAVRTLDGKTLTRADFVGKPWIINLWVPG